MATPLAAHCGCPKIFILTLYCFDSVILNCFQGFVDIDYQSCASIYNYFKLVNKQNQKWWHTRCVYGIGEKCYEVQFN